MIDLASRPEIKVVNGGDLSLNRSMSDLLIKEKLIKLTVIEFEHLLEKDPGFSGAFEALLKNFVSPNFRSLASIARHTEFARLFAVAKPRKVKPVDYAMYLPKRPDSLRQANTHIRYLHAGLLASPRSWNYVPEALLRVMSPIHISKRVP